MNTPPPLPAKSPDWWSRNWKWFVPAVCVAVMVVICAFVVSVFAIMRSSDAYAGALARAERAPAVAQAIGTPITDRFFFTGQINVNGASGNADLVIPIEGPKGKATIYVAAHKSDGTWHYTRLIVQCASNGQQVDLSEPDSPRTRL